MLFLVLIDMLIHVGLFHLGYYFFESLKDPDREEKSLSPGVVTVIAIVVYLIFN